MFIHGSPFHNHCARVVAVCAGALIAGCGAQMFLRIERQQLDERVVFFLGGGGNSLALLHRGGSLLIDTKMLGMAQTLRSQVETDLAHEVQRILLTHSHGDHVGGLRLYPQAKVVVVHPNTRRRLEESGVRAPFVEVTNEIVLTLGGERVRIKYLGVGHTDGDLVALLEQHRLLVAGDLVTAFEPRIDVAAGGDALALGHTLEAMLSLDFDRVLPGHGDVMSRKDVEHLRDYLAALEVAMRKARAERLTEDLAVAAVTSAMSPDLFLAPMPLGANRERTAHQMFQSLELAR